MSSSKYLTQIFNQSGERKYEGSELTEKGRCANSVSTDTELIREQLVQGEPQPYELKADSLIGRPAASSTVDLPESVVVAWTQALGIPTRNRMTKKSGLRKIRVVSA